ncbi:MAG: DUF6483 family protein [Lachnospiraceae bacterium]
MAVKQDYLMRMIQDGVQFLGKILLGKDHPLYELPKEEHYNANDHLYAKIIRMAEEGKINEAENELLEYIDGRELELLEMALSFYQHVAELDDDFLEEHNYTREEIRDGLNALARSCNVSGLEL